MSPEQNYPVNLGMACPKGWESLTPLAAPDRATTPLLRNPETGALEPADWDEALQVFTLKFRALMDQHGPESVAFLSTGQICTEEMAFLGALWKFGIGALHGPILGAFAYTLIGEIGQSITERQRLVEGLVILAAVLLLPRGISGLQPRRSLPI